MRAQYKEAANTLVSDLILQGKVIERGLQGELFARLLFTLARDLPHGPAFVSDQPGPSEPSEPYVNPTQVGALLEALLGPDLGLPPSRGDGNTQKRSHATTQIEDAVSKSYHGPVENGWINFTHIVQLEQPLKTVPW